MDMNILLFIGLAILVIFLVVGIIHKIVSMIVSVVVVVVLAGVVWNFMPIEYKACIDLSLALTGSKFFSEISPEHEALIDKTDVKVNLNSAFTLAYPQFTSTSSRKDPITNENNHEFDMNLFTFDKNLKSIRVISSPKNADKVVNVLKGLGITVRIP